MRTKCGTMHSSSSLCSLEACILDLDSIIDQCNNWYTNFSGSLLVHKEKRTSTPMSP